MSSRISRLLETVFRFWAWRIGNRNLHHHCGLFFLASGIRLQNSGNEDVIGLSVFAILGACLAWVIQQIFPPDENKAA